ncbi:hypothetical protein [Hymenobacter algoricola]|uniref:Outer membrane protein beta-barrel domain-containing protein n=1 Tax=Hymenobacter algoricola TaxID=486267 RepID=A0ABP7MM41_9BACT
MKTLTSSLFLITVVASMPALAQTAIRRPATSSGPTKTVGVPKNTTVKANTTPALASRAAARPAPVRPVTPAPQAAPAPSRGAAEPASATPQVAAAPVVPNATGELFEKGTTMVNLGVGLGLGYAGYYGTLKSTPALSVSAERGVLDGVGPGTIGIGGLIGYKAYHYNYGTGNYKATWTNVLVSVRGTYHYNLLQHPKLDTYGGVSMGVRVQTWKDTFYDSSPTTQGYTANSVHVMPGVFVGARYFLTDNLGAFTEVGYDMSYLKLGLTARF